MRADAFSVAGAATPPEDDKTPVIALDMDAIYDAATRPALLFMLEFECDGAVFVWSGKAKDAGSAEIIGRGELHDMFAGFDRFGARLVRCEVAGEKVA